jgi:8-oxo-dGTP pyrophosphatase MutT (NUDIX family)
MLFDPCIQILRTRLQQPLPGMDAQFEMAHVNRERIRYDQLDTTAFRPSAVLLLIYPGAGTEAEILLIERPTYQGFHSGQIALPGGKAEKSDTSLEQTALREFFEETGSDLQPEILGRLTPVYIPISTFVVHPFVACTPSKPSFQPSEREVAQLLELPVAELLLPSLVKETVLEPAPNMKLKTPYFDVRGKVLWGATAMMLNELKHILRD